MWQRRRKREAFAPPIAMIHKAGCSVKRESTNLVACARWQLARCSLSLVLRWSEHQSRPQLQEKPVRSGGLLPRHVSARVRCRPGWAGSPLSLRPMLTIWIAIELNWLNQLKRPIGAMGTIDSQSIRISLKPVSNRFELNWGHFWISLIVSYIYNHIYNHIYKRHIYIYIIC